ncbi:hypothetical protein PybrP1_002783 [[Pythium] brassicae (nom. inval.)]|nr:hypothetical protein PybrP1_002783 [[Pythium] brassicae (nom. inval.)]
MAASRVQRVQRVVVSALEASSAALSSRRQRGVQTPTPAGKPRRRARLQQLTPRTPAETAARFERLVRDTAARRRRGTPSPQSPAPIASGDRADTTALKQQRVGEQEQEHVAPTVVAAKPSVAPSGNTSEDEELLRIQKRLVFGRKPPQKKRVATRANERDSSDSGDTAEEEEEEEKRTRPASASPRARSDQTARLSVGFSVLEAVAVPPQPKSDTARRKAASPTASTTQALVLLSEWTLRWPLTSARRSRRGDSSDSSDSEEGKGKAPTAAARRKQLQLVLEGRVLGRDASFCVARRVSGAQFVAATGERVQLDGCIDVEKSDARGLPDAVIELLLEGLPQFWRRKLTALVAAPTARQTRKQSESEPEDEDAVVRVKRSRSGRVIAPVMDWWRGERLTTDVNGVTVVDRGSPASWKRAPTPSKATEPSRAGPPGKPPRVPTAAQTPVAKAKQAPTGMRSEKKQRQPRQPRQSSSEADEWSDEQLQALAAAKMQIPTTATNFWAEVAAFVAGKSADECRSKSFEAFASPTGRAAKKRAAPATPASVTKIPTKLHRAGSNLFKKQVRTFVHEYEKKHVDDVFADTTPTKAELRGALGLDDLESPSAPLDTSAARGDDDDDDDDFVGARDVLHEITARERDEVDSYVLGIKRRRLLGEPAGGAKATASRARSSFSTPSSLKKKPLKRSVHMYEAIGSHRVEGVVSPGGTTRVRVNKDSDATSDDDDDDERDSDEENESDDAF